MTGKYQQNGFGYISVLVIIFVMALFISSAYESIYTSTKREKELELIFRGNQYAQAIESYYRVLPNGVNELPNKLDDLVSDSRRLPALKHLRKLYSDPITGLNDWVLIKNDDEKIIGIRSSSDETPLFHNFYKSRYISPEVFTKASSYAEWTFVFLPQGQNP